MNNSGSGSSLPTLEAVADDSNTLRLKIMGRLDVYTTGEVWKAALSAVEKSKPNKLIIEAEGIEYCDASGIALLMELGLHQRQRGGSYKIEGLREDLLKLYELFKPEDFSETAQPDAESTKNPIVRIGEKSYEVWEEIKIHIIFTGQITAALAGALLNPFKVRWSEVLLTSEKFGANSFFIIALVNFLVGLVIAFQSAIPMKTYGADVFVADLIVIAYFKELGPLMTAFVVNGRSGSAFAAELGTMKVNEELDALNTMGLDPVKFLVLPKVIAALFMLPLLTVFGNLFGLIGGLVVIMSLGYTFSTYINQITASGTYVMLLAGLFKTLFFAVIIAGVGCLAGMRASRGPSAVGDAATRAVVTGIILMIIVDGIFGVLYYVLGI
ncbi:MAG: ABC transporter permease [Deltaproteobacteria bacterium]